MKKHDKMVAFIMQNIAAQENIIRLDSLRILVFTVMTIYLHLTGQ